MHCTKQTEIHLEATAADVSVRPAAFYFEAVYVYPPPLPPASCDFVEADVLGAAAALLLATADTAFRTVIPLAINDASLKRCAMG